MTVCPSTHIGWLFIGWLCLAWTPLSAQTPESLADDAPAAMELPVIDHEAQGRLLSVQEFLANQQWEEAVEGVRQVMTAQPDALVQVELQQGETAGFVRYRPASHYIQSLLASWHTTAPAALELYRRRVDNAAARQLETAIANRDMLLLQRTIDDYFASSFGDETLVAMGSLALQRGLYQRAREAFDWLGGLPRMPGGQPAWLAVEQVGAQHSERIRAAISRLETTGRFPDPQLPQADIAARAVVCSQLAGQRRRAATERRLFELIYPQATGELSGRSGSWSELLKQVADSPLLPARFSSWSTFAGRVDRVPGLPELDVQRTRRWQVTLPRMAAPNGREHVDQPRVAEGRDGLLSYFPVVWNDTLLVQTPDGIFGYDLPTGDVAWPALDVPGLLHQTKSDPTTFLQEGPIHQGVPRFTLTVKHDLLLAVDGAYTNPQAPPQAPPITSRLVGIDLPTQKVEFQLQPEDRGWVFAGAPVADDDRFYVCQVRRDRVRQAMRIVAYDLTTGRRVWSTELGRADIAATVAAFHQELLTLHEDRLFVSTNLGSIAALRTQDGRFHWVTSYPRIGRRLTDPDWSDRHRFRDLTPCLVHHDVVVCAPRDTDRVFALSRLDGSLLWTTAEQEAADVTQLLGVTNDRLICSGDRLYAVGVYSGRIHGVFPYPGRTPPGQSLPFPHGMGRGLVAGDRIYWPAPDKVYVLQGTDLTPVAEPIPGLAGGANLIWQRDRLILAGADQLVAYRTRSLTTTDENLDQRAASYQSAPSKFPKELANYEQESSRYR